MLPSWLVDASGRRKDIGEQPMKEMSEGGGPESREVVQERSRIARWGFSVDWWSVILAALAALVLKLGLIPAVPW
jgi:hypothetical protein